MQHWVGLGNPGTRYALQRHNVGFMAADILAEAHDFGPWQKKFRSLIAEGGGEAAAEGGRKGEE
jgi:PTH1 family peptidyl-tRNA hydrolase